MDQSDLQVGTVTLPRWQCQRTACGNTWTSKTPERPRCCSKCKSPYWDRPGPSRVPKKRRGR